MKAKVQKYVKTVLSPVWSAYHRLENQRKNPAVNERLQEYLFALDSINEGYVGRIADIGTGEGSWPSLLSSCGFRVDAFDKKKNYWSVFSNHHQRVRSLDITKEPTPEIYDVVTCISVIEHIGDSKAAVKNMYKSLRTGGLCVLTFPYNSEEAHQNIYEHPSAGYGKDYLFHTSVYNAQTINDWIEGLGFEVVNREVYQAFSGRLWTFGKRVFPVIKSSEDAPHHLMCLLLRKVD